jgi:DNA adenine methylase
MGFRAARRTQDRSFPTPTWYNLRSALPVPESVHPLSMESAAKAEILPPLLRWAGSKRKLLPRLLSHVPKNFKRYVEPFSGSACLFFAARPASAIIADLNAQLIEAYQVVRAHPLKTARALSGMSSERTAYYSVRSQVPASLTEVERAARFIYLNRHCFNGVYRTNKSGQFNVPLGTRLGMIPNEKHFNRCAHALRSAELMSGDFESVLAKVMEGDFVYLDPPYAKINSRIRGEYGYNSFGVQDLLRLSESLVKIDRIGSTFLLSYANCPEIETIRNSWFSDVIEVRRQIGGFARHREIVTEVLISNRPLRDDSTVPK